MLKIPYNIKHKIPNILTISRVLAIPLFVYLMYMANDVGFVSAGIVFGLAALTDIFDGYLARHWGAQSTFGTVFDSIADKLLVITALVMLISTRCISGINVIPALLIITREVFMSGAREFMAHYKKQVYATPVARWKTVVQCCALFGAIIQNVSFWQSHNFTIAISFLLWSAAALTIYTLFDYIIIIFGSDITAN